MDNEITNTEKKINELSQEVYSLRSELEAQKNLTNVTIQTLTDELNMMKFKSGQSSNSIKSDKDYIISPLNKIVMQSNGISRSEMSFDYSEAASNPEYRLYQEENGGDFIIESVGNNSKVIINPTSFNGYGVDESTLRAGGTSTYAYLLVEPTVAGFYTDGTNTFRLRFPNHSSDPAACTVGEICVSGAKLKICTATNTWTVVGTQS